MSSRVTQCATDKRKVLWKRDHVGSPPATPKGRDPLYALLNIITNKLGKEGLEDFKKWLSAEAPDRCRRRDGDRATKIQETTPQAQDELRQKPQELLNTPDQDLSGSPKQGMVEMTRKLTKRRVGASPGEGPLCKKVNFENHDLDKFKRGAQDFVPLVIWNRARSPHR